MKINNNIQKELLEIAPKLAALPKQNNFVVPSNYFAEGLPDAAIAGIIEDKLYPLKNTNPFIAPENNFEEGTAYLAVMAEIFIEPYQYLKEKNIFKIPTTYFDGLADSITEQVILDTVNNESESVLFANGTPKFSVPENYFNNLSDLIIDKVKQEDAQEIVLNPLLKQMQGEVIFNLPEGYFSNLEDRIIEQIHAPKIKSIERTEAKVVKFPFQRVMAIAAMLALFLGGAWLFQNSGLSANVSFEEQFAQLSNEDIKNYINDHESDFDGYLLADAASNELNDNLFEGVQLDDSEKDFYLNNIEDDIINEWYNENAI